MIVLRIKASEAIVELKRFEQLVSQSNKIQRVIAELLYARTEQRQRMAL
jgi:hypothetical protein